MTERFFLFISILMTLAWSPLSQANDIWSARDFNRESFVRVRPQAFEVAPYSQGRQIRLCTFDRGNETCHNYPHSMSPSGEFLFAQNRNNWNTFFNTCREFDARNRFTLSVQIASIFATAGAGAVTGTLRLMAAPALASEMITPTPEEYPSVSHEYIDQAQNMLNYMLSGNGRYDVYPMVEIARLKVVLDLCSTHFNSEVLRNNRRQCLGSCHSMPAEEIIPPQPETRPRCTTCTNSNITDDDISDVQEYLNSIN